MSTAIQQAIQRLNRTELSCTAILSHLSNAFITRALDPGFNELINVDQQRQELIETYEILSNLILSLEEQAKA